MGIVQIIMTPLSWLYGIVIYFRNILYDLRIIPVYHSPVPVISVGNITVGGTGKTPFVEYLVKRYLKRGNRACVISRGYKRLTHGTQVVSDGMSVIGNALSVGDEPYQIAKKFPGAVVVVSEKRGVAADYAMKQYKPQLFILDDGFQHRSMARNVDIVMIDRARELIKIPLLPAGRRREHLSALKRADLLIKSGTGKDDTLFVEDSKVEMRYKVCGFRSLKGGRVYSVDQMRGKKCVVFAGIGNPAGFLSTLKEIDIEIAAFHEYPDHCIYSEKDLDKIRFSLETTKGDFVVTTEKDTVRLESLKLTEAFPSQHFLSVIIEAIIVEGEDILLKILHEKIDKLII